MTRRCKPGQRARIIDGVDTGKIVLVVRYYCGEDVAGGPWPEAIFPWVVASLGPPLHVEDLDTGLPCPPSMVAVYDDCDLELLPDDDDPADAEIEDVPTMPSKPAVVLLQR